ncbi:LLM class flavin-dependent oxidoreductase [Acidisphaera sp. L21]|uniref:LLM class flavin-dependent oxidoreductase n=1 Tax=Acidisphaera sp. L21 TaxID=1641851 RepID=UPI00131C069F|nr:LLM class flavin-dependent oxidoreductase [Acidisphaera sp. L21]
MTGRQLHLGVFIYPGGHHIAAWRHPAMQAQRITELGYYRECAQIAERGKFDMFFVGDALNAREREGRVMGQVAINNLDPVSIVSAIASVTERIGLVATLSTTYHEPFSIASKFATLDHLSGGRAGWNVVTTSDDKSALNFSRTHAMDKALRYERAAAFVDVVTGLWDSWDDGAVVGDAATGQFLDPASIHAVDHSSPFFAVAGPAMMPRPPQGWPVLVQAGGSPPGRDFAARIGEAIFTAQGELPEAQAFRSDIHARMAARGRSANSVKIMPGLSPMLGDTEAAAQRRAEEFAELVDPAVGVWMLTEMTKFRLYDHPLDQPLPTADIRASSPALNRNATTLVERAEREALTLRDAARIMVRSRVHQSFVGTPEQLAGHMSHWLEAGGCDGFNILPPLFPDDLATFVDQVVPVLQRLGVFRREYSGSTLRDHLGLPRPKGRSINTAGL